MGRLPGRAAGDRSKAFSRYGQRRRDNRRHPHLYSRLHVRKDYDEPLERAAERRRYSLCVWLHNLLQPTSSLLWGRRTAGWSAITPAFHGLGGAQGFSRDTDRATAGEQPALRVQSTLPSHGYNLMEVKKDELICTMKAVRTIQEPQSEMFTLARFRVPDGQVEIQRTDVPAAVSTP